MIDEPRTLTQTPDELHLLVHALTSMPGAFSEVATVWRRTRRSRTDLPLGVPLRLERSAHQLKDIAECLRWAGPSEWPALMLEVMNQLRALNADITAAAAMTCGPGSPPAGDAGLWGYLGAAMNQARLHALNLMLTPPGGMNQPADGRDAPASASPGQSGLLHGLR